MAIREQSAVAVYSRWYPDTVRHLALASGQIQYTPDLIAFSLFAN